MGAVGKVLLQGGKLQENGSTLRGGKMVRRTPTSVLRGGLANGQRVMAGYEGRRRVGVRKVGG